MGFLPGAIEIVLAWHRKLNFSGPVLTLGNQEIWASYEELVALFNQSACPYKPQTEIIPHTSRTFSDNPECMKISENFVHARVLFSMMGIDDYTDMDKFDSDKPVILHDMNLPVDEKLHDRYSLIVDGGTIEHIFDMRQVMENILKMLRPGGHVIHIAGFFMDHGFYGLSPCFFYDFYKANGFTDFECTILQVNYDNILRDYKKTWPHFDYTYGMRMDELLEHDKKVLIFFAARRSHVLPGLVMPVQGIFAARS